MSNHSWQKRNGDSHVKLWLAKAKCSSQCEIRGWQLRFGDSKVKPCSNQSIHSSMVLEQMIDTEKPVAVITDSIDSFCVECEGLKSKSVIHGMVIDT
ncbi:hypothetical protein L1987_47504 [Smallanthus sonchifolius]|uniref:Uncharacterized protein n=1 Tax=Smallanthus sonchifolius TaxID=185202 RepID=A0ACB9G3D6_9ASTR|nr:hypothetical protein L1987_47504 [Smallanthus sonchifolius]